MAKICRLAGLFLVLFLLWAFIPATVHAEPGVTPATWGTCEMGRTAPSTAWYFANAETSAGKVAYLLLQNPSPATANMTLTCRTTVGETIIRTYTLSANSRKTIRLNDIVPSGEFGMRVVATQPVLAERSMYNGTPAPCLTVTSICPNTGVACSCANVTDLAGTGFQAGATVRLEAGTTIVNATNITVVSDTKITCQFVLPATPGKYDVVVKNPDGQEARLAKGFSVVTNTCGQGAGAFISVFAGLLGLLSMAGLGRRRRRRS